VVASLAAFSLAVWLAALLMAVALGYSGARRIGPRARTENSTRSDLASPATAMRANAIRPSQNRPPDNCRRASSSGLTQKTAARRRNICAKLTYRFYNSPTWRAGRSGMSLTLFIPALRSCFPQNECARRLSTLPAISTAIPRMWARRRVVAVADWLQ